MLHTGLLPRPLAIWGVVGYLVILADSVLQVLGFQLNSIQAVPGGLWEVFIGVWLIVKGFSTPTAQNLADLDPIAHPVRRQHQ